MAVNAASCVNSSHFAVSIKIWATLKTNGEVDKKAELWSQTTVDVALSNLHWLAEAQRAIERHVAKVKRRPNPSPWPAQWGLAGNRGNMSEEQQRCSRASALRHLANLITDEDRLLQPPPPPLYLASGALPAAPPPPHRKKIKKVHRRIWTNKAKLGKRRRRPRENS